MQVSLTFTGSVPNIKGILSRLDNEELGAVSVAVADEEVMKKRKRRTKAELAAAKEAEEETAEDDEEETDEISPRSKKKAAIKDEEDEDAVDEEEAEDSDDSDTDEEDDGEEVEEDGDNEEEAEEKEKPIKAKKAAVSKGKTPKALTLEGDLIPAFKKYAVKFSREKAGKILKKYKVDSVRDIPVSKFEAVMKELKV